MLKEIRIYDSFCTDPYQNLATEKYLLENTPAGVCTLYLWQNQNTVVIGRNQNPWAECRVSLLEEEGGKLARRLSGGGAVFHDLGNLNFTFLTDENSYDLEKQLSVIQTACKYLGIQAYASGRNDLLVDGLKFSGNAFYHSQGNAYHHGTLLVNANMDKLSRYLSPSKAKLAAKGVASVRSRVANLSQFAPGLTCDKLRDAMKNAFSEVYGLEAKPMVLDEAAHAIIQEETQISGSWQWLYGSPLPFSFQCEERFSWGQALLQLNAQGGMIQSAKFYSDAMDWTLSKRVEKALTGICFSQATILDAISKAGLVSDISDDLCQLIKAQAI